MKQKIHFTDPYLISPTNPVSVNLIGAGRTGSQVLHLLGRMNYTLLAHGHPGLFVRLFDGDTITKSNIGCQLFFENEIGFNKAAVLINRANRQYGTNWKAFPYHYDKENFQVNEKYLAANIIISCVDTIAARFTIEISAKQNTVTQVPATEEITLSEKTADIKIQKEKTIETDFENPVQEHKGAGIKDLLEDLMQAEKGGGNVPYELRKKKRKKRKRKPRL